MKEDLKSTWVPLAPTVPSRLAQLLTKHSVLCELQRCTANGSEARLLYPVLYTRLRLGPLQGDPRVLAGRVQSLLVLGLGFAGDPTLRELVRRDMQPLMQAFERVCRRDCDRAFLSHMVRHHQDGMRMAEMARSKAVHPELKQLAEQMIRSQIEDIRKFQRMLAER